MLRTILVGVDGSTDSEAALGLAVRWAKQRDVLLVGFGCVDEPGIRQGPEDFMFGEFLLKNLNETILADVSTRVENALCQAAQRCAEAGVAFKPLEDVGTPHVRLLEEAQRYDLVVVGGKTHFRYGWENDPDTTLDRFLSDCPRPVLAVSEDRGDSGKVVVAYDGSPPAARALFTFESTGLGVGREIHVVSIDEEKREASRHAELAVEFLKFHGLDVRPFPVASAEPTADVLLETVRSLEPSMVVMGAYGKSALRDFFLGSTTRKMIEKGSVPMFLYH